MSRRFIALSLASSLVVQPLAMTCLSSPIPRFSETPIRNFSEQALALSAIHGITAVDSHTSSRVKEQEAKQLPARTWTVLDFDLPGTQLPSVHLPMGKVRDFVISPTADLLAVHTENKSKFGNSYCDVRLHGIHRISLEGLEEKSVIIIRYSFIGRICINKCNKR